MKLVRFLRPAPEYSAYTGEEMAFDDALAAMLVAKGRAEFIVVSPTVVKMQAEPEIPAKFAPSTPEPEEELYPAFVGDDDGRGIAGPPVGDPVRRGPGRPRKQF